MKTLKKFSTISLKKKLKNIKYILLVINNQRSYFVLDNQEFSEWLCRLEHNSRNRAFPSYRCTYMGRLSDKDIDSYGTFSVRRLFDWYMGFVQLDNILKFILKDLWPTGQYPSIYFEIFMTDCTISLKLYRNIYGRLDNILPETILRY